MGYGLPGSTVISPGSASLADIWRYALNYVLAPNDPELQQMVLDAANAAIDKINSRNWEQLVKMQEIALVEDTDEYDLATDFRMPRNCNLLNTESKREGRLSYKQLKTLLHEQPCATQSGDPGEYSIDFSTRKLKLSYAPGSSYVAKYPELALYYYPRIAHLVDPDDQINGLPSEFTSWLKWYCRVEAAMIRAPQRAGLAQRECDERWGMLVADNSDTLTDWE